MWDKGHLQFQTGAGSRKAEATNRTLCSSKPGCISLNSKWKNLQELNLRKNGLNRAVPSAAFTLLEKLLHLWACFPTRKSHPIVDFLEFSPLDF